MVDPISYHYSLIIRCWRDSNGILRGWLVDALTQRSYPFAALEEAAALIDSLTREPAPAGDMQEDDKTDEGG